MKNIIDSAIRIIEKMEREKLPVRAFIAKYQELFAGVDKRSLIPPECREHDIYTETAYVFVVGSYIYQLRACALSLILNMLCLHWLSSICGLQVLSAVLARTMLPLVA